MSLAKPESEGEHKSHVDIPAEWLAEFEAAARRPLATRVKYSFIHTYKPVLDDATYRAFDTMEEYRRWCEETWPVSHRGVRGRLRRSASNIGNDARYRTEDNPPVSPLGKGGGL